jgi:outer membrane protein assembly factor BamB
MRRTSLIVLWVAGCTSVSAQNWPSFRGPEASGVAEGFPTVMTWNVATSQNVLWKAPIPGLAVSSPIVWGDHVFVSTAVSSDPAAGIKTGLYGDVQPSADLSKHSWRLIALDKRNGKVLWDRVAFEGVPKTKRHPKSSQASPTPVTDGRRVIVSFGSQGLYAYDFDGKLLWKRDLGVLNAGWFYDPDYEWGVGSSPIIWKDLVIVQCDIQKSSFIAAFDVATGRPVWRTEREEIPSWSTPTIFDANGRAELVTQATKFTRGYDPRTGKELWRLSGNSEIAIPTPVVGPNLIIVSNGYSPVQPIFAIKPGGTGDITPKNGQTQSEFIAWSTNRGGPYIPTPVIYRDQLYVLGINGVLAAYDVRTGQRVYQERVGMGGSFSASPVAADGKLYLSSEDGDVFVVKAGPKYEPLATNSVGEVVMATPAISGGVIIIRGVKQVIAVGEKR